MREKIKLQITVCSITIQWNLFKLLGENLFWDIWEVISIYSRTSENTSQKSVNKLLFLEMSKMWGPKSKCLINRQTNFKNI